MGIVGSVNNDKTFGEEKMNVNDMTIGQAKELAAMFSASPAQSTLNGMIGKKVIIRTYSAGVFFGTLTEKA